MVGHVSDKSLEGYISNTTVMKQTAAEALAFNSMARVPKRQCTVEKVKETTSAIAPVYNITVTNCPGVVISIGSIGDVEK
jgi:hypothetical protein